MDTLTADNKSLATQIIRNTLANWVTKLLIAASAILTTPLIISGLGKYEYGVWVLVGQIINFLLIADLGVANTVCRLISKYDALEDSQSKQSIFTTSLFIFFLAMTLLSGVVLVTVDVLPRMLEVEAQYVEVTRHVFLIMAVNVIVIVPLRIGRGLLQAKHRFDYVDLASAAGKLLQLMVVVAMFYMNSINLLALAWALAIINTLAELYMFSLARHMHSDLQFRITGITMSAFKEIMSMGGASIVQTMSGAVSRQGMVLVVGMLLGVIYAPLYAVPLVVLLTIGPLVGRVGTVFMPIVSAYDSVAEVKKILSLSVYGTRYTFMLGLVITGYIFFYGKLVLQLWLPDSEISSGDIEIMSNILLLLIFPFVLARSNQGNRVILYSTGHHWFVSWALLGSSILGIVTAVTLILTTKLGVYAVVCGLVVKLIIGDYFVIYRKLQKKYSIDGLRYCYLTFARPVVTIFSILAIMILINDFLPTVSFVDLLISSSIYFTVSVVLVYTLCLDKKHVGMLMPARFKFV